MNRIQSRLALIVLALVFVLAGLQAESYTDNEFLRKSRELQALAASAFDGGDYDAATAYAKEARDWALRSDEYIAKSVADARSAAQAKAEADRLAAARSEAEELLGRAAARFAWATGVNAKATYPDAYGKAGRGLGEARTAFDGSDYPLSKQRSEEVLAALAGVGEFAPWPAVYKVRLIPKRSDCLWRIAEYPFVYNDPLKWPLLYEANKKTFRDPGNPNLIFPGQLLTIPSVNGEQREGTYDPTRSYATFPKTKK